MSEQAERIVTSAGIPADPHTRLTVLETHTSHTSHTVEEMAAILREEDDELLADVRDGTWLNKTEFAPIQWAVPGLVPEGLTILVGPPKAGKSWLLANLLLSVAAGGKSIGVLQIPEPKKVLYLALEDGDRRMQSRCRTLLGASEDIPENFHYKTSVPPGKVVRVIEAWMRRHPDTSMVVLDTLGKVMPQAMQGESSYQRDYRVGGDLKKVADDNPGLALIVIHHDRKAASEDFVDSVSGTNGLAGSADTIMVLARKRKATNAVLHVTGRDVPEEEYALDLHDGVNWVLDGTDLMDAAAAAARRQESETISDKSAQIIDYIRSQPSGQAGAKELADKFGSGVYEYLRRHSDAGRILKVGRGVYAVPS
ncbi:AAA family ATPase [Actinomadura sp. NPDC048032]|uniref:AAA family ATPase n=1 Tax=Actinomadura sp. NPDC048032 TaxID=3155747 RepID=UPI0033F34AF8